jgi:hypothetical protein
MVLGRKLWELFLNGGEAGENHGKPLTGVQIFIRTMDLVNTIPQC